MIESLTSSVTAIADLGGAVTTTTTVTRVCDRCGFQFPEDKLVEEPHTGYMVCTRHGCLDKEGPKPSED